MLSTSLSFKEWGEDVFPQSTSAMAGTPTVTMGLSATEDHPVYPLSLERSVQLGPVVYVNPPNATASLPGGCLEPVQRKQGNPS